VGLFDGVFGENGGLEREERRVAPLLTTTIDEKVFNSG